MPQPHSTESLIHVLDALERAVMSPKGIRVAFPSRKRAEKFRFTCYTYRSRARKQQAKAIQSGQFAPEASTPWDKLAFTVVEREEKWYLEITPPNLDHSAIEEI